MSARLAPQVVKSQNCNPQPNLILKRAAEKLRAFVCVRHLYGRLHLYGRRRFFRRSAL